MEIIIYSKDNCPNCLKTQNILLKYNPIVLKIGQDISREKFLAKFPNAKEVPQVLVNGEHIGGFADVEKWFAFNNPQEDF